MRDCPQVTELVAEHRPAEDQLGLRDRGASGPAVGRPTPGPRLARAADINETHGDTRVEERCDRVAAFFQEGLLSGLGHHHDDR